MASQHIQLSGEDLARPAEHLPLKAIRDISYKLHRALSNSGNWETIAEELGYDWEEIKHFQAVAAVRQDATPGELMLQDWRQKGNGRTLYVLHDALRAAGRSDCVELLEKEIYEKLVCMDLRVGIKYKSDKQVEHRKVRTRMEATILDSLHNLLEQPVTENYQLLDHSASWTHTLAREFRGRELMLLRCTSMTPMEQDPTVDSSSSSAHSPSHTSPPADSGKHRLGSLENQSFQPLYSAAQRAVNHCRESTTAVNNCSAASSSNLNNLDCHGNEYSSAARRVITPMNIPLSSSSADNVCTRAKQVGAYPDVNDMRSDDDPRCNTYPVAEGSQQREGVADTRGHGPHTTNIVRHDRGTEMQNEKTQLKTVTDDFGIRRKSDWGSSAQTVPQGLDKMAIVSDRNCHSIAESRDHSEFTVGFRDQRTHRQISSYAVYKDPEEHGMYRDSDYCAKYRHSDQFKGHAEYRDPAECTEYRDPENVDDYRDPEGFYMHTSRYPGNIDADPENDSEYRDPEINGEYRDPENIDAYRDSKNIDEYRDPENIDQYRDPENIDEYRDPELGIQASADDEDSRFHLNNAIDEETAEYIDSEEYRDPCEAECLWNNDDASMGLVHPRNVNRYQEDVLGVDTTACDYQLAHVIEGEINEETGVKQFAETDVEQTSVKGCFNLYPDTAVSSASSTCVSTDSSDRELVVSKATFRPELLTSGIDQEELAADAGHLVASCVEEMQTATDDMGESYYMDFNRYPQDTEENSSNNMSPGLPSAHPRFPERMTSGNSEPFQRSHSTVANFPNPARNRMEVFKGSKSTAVKSVEPNRRRREVLAWSQSTVEPNLVPERGMQSGGENVYESLNRQQSCPAYSSFSEVTSAGMDGLSGGITIADVFSPQTEEFKMEDFELEAGKAKAGAVPKHVSFDDETATSSFKRVSFEADSAISSVKRVSFDAEAATPSFDSPSRSLSIDPDSRSVSLRDKSLQSESIANQRKFFKQRNSLPNFSTNFDRPPLRQSASVCKPPHPYKMVVGGKTSRPSLDQCLVGDNIFAHYNKVLKGYIGWSPKETENTVIKTMADTLKESGYYVLWYWRNKSQLIISISHRGKLENFRVFTKVLKDMGLVFYVYKEQKFQSILDLLKYYSYHGLELPASSGSRSQQGQGSVGLGVVLHMRCPVVVQYDRTQAFSV